MEKHNNTSQNIQISQMNKHDDSCYLTFSASRGTVRWNVSKGLKMSIAAAGGVVDAFLLFRVPLPFANLTHYPSSEPERGVNKEPLSA